MTLTHPRTPLMRLLFACALALAGMPGPLHAAPPPSPRPIPDALRADAADAGDTWRTAGQPRHLLRLPGFLFVRAAAEVDPTRDAIRARLSRTPLEQVPSVWHDRWGSILALPEAERLAHARDPLAMRAALERAREIAGLQVDPVLIDPDQGLFRLPTSGIVLQYREGARPQALLPAPAWSWRPLRGATRQLILWHPVPLSLETLLATVSTLDQHPDVLWAAPDFAGEARRQLTPNDTYFSQQWHHRNQGQSGAKWDADTDITGAWDHVSGEGVVIAIIDDGVQIDHPDLVDNIYANTAEPWDSVDNDGNGYVDDTSGWDFFNDDRDPKPYHFYDNHGTATSGVAAGRGENARGITGAAYRAHILPVKLLDGFSGVLDSQIAEAFRYAAGLTSPNGWRGADVISVSLSLPWSTVTDSAITAAATLGRNGLGCPVFVATGNGASAYRPYTFPVSIAPGNWYFEWDYVKDRSGSSGEDTVRIANIRFPDGSHERFDAPSLPAGWNASPYGGPAWYIEDNPARAYGVGRYQARSGVTPDRGRASLRSKTLTVSSSGTLSFDYWISSQYGVIAGDRLEIYAYNAGTGASSSYRVDSGAYSITTSPSYPASHGSTIAVGASTDFDYRSDYSQYGSGLDLVTPSSGGFAGIWTTDRTGADGYNASGDYDSAFGGTSSATPLAAGIGALLLNARPGLTAASVRSFLRMSCEKVGGVTYSGGAAGAGGWNSYYGYGRLNADIALGLSYLTVTSGPNGSVPTPGESTWLHYRGDTVALTSSPDPYYHHTNWTVTAGSSPLDNPAAAVAVLTMQDDTTVRADFAPNLAPQGTPEYWLAGYGLTQPSFAAQEALDADHDGHTSGEEWRAGTVPTNSTSLLRIDALSHAATSTVLSWQSVGDRTYDILFQSNLTTAIPTPLVTALPGTPPLNVCTTSPPATATGFYRIRTAPPAP